MVVHLADVAGTLHQQPPAVPIPAIQGTNSLIHFIRVVHNHKAEAPAFTSPSSNNPGLPHFAIFGKLAFQLPFCDYKVQTSNKDVQAIFI